MQKWQNYRICLHILSIFVNKIQQCVGTALFFSVDVLEVDEMTDSIYFSGSNSNSSLFCECVN